MTRGAVSLMSDMTRVAAIAVHVKRHEQGVCAPAGGPAENAGGIALTPAAIAESRSWTSPLPNSEVGNPPDYCSQGAQGSSLGGPFSCPFHVKPDAR